MEEKKTQSEQATGTLFSNFWYRKQGIIQFVSIICGVGALFLAIPAPTDELAKSALENIQFIWIIFITAGIIVLFVNLYLFLYQLELKVQEKTKYPLIIQGSFSFILFGLAMTFCFNLWQYASAIYKGPLSNFEHALANSGVWFILWILLFLISRVKNKFNILLYILFESTLWSIFATLAGYIISRNRFSSLDIWISILVIFSLSLLLSAFGEWRKQKSKQIKLDNQVVLKESLNN